MPKKTSLVDFNTLTHKRDWKTYLTLDWYNSLKRLLQWELSFCDTCNFNNKWVCTMYQKSNPWWQKNKESSCCEGCSFLWKKWCTTENLACMSYACNTALKSMWDQKSKGLEEIKRFIEDLLIQHWFQFTAWIRISKSELMFLLVRE